MDVSIKTSMTSVNHKARPVVEGEHDKSWNNCDLILVPKTAMISWQKLSGKSMEPNAASFVVISIGL